MIARPSPFVQGSIALHFIAAGVVATRPSWWPVAIGAVVADHAAVVAAGLWPTSALLGPNIRRLPPQAMARGEIALTIDDGPDPEVTPRVLDLLDAEDLRATFFCVGERVLRYSAVARAIVARGHSVENHSQRHRHDFSLLGPGAIERELVASQRSIADTVGRVPRFFRAPAGLRNVFLQSALERHALELTSWTHRAFDTVTRDPAVVARRLTSRVVAGDILLLHDGHAARTKSDIPVIVEALPLVAEALRAARLSGVTIGAALR